MLNQFSRTQLLFGAEALKKLTSCRVAVFGIGGVGGYAVEALARSGIGALDLVDNDKICLTNLNRQIYATHKTLGKYKVDAAAERIADINPECRVTTHKIFYLPETQFDFTVYDYIIDAIDTVTGKISLVKRAKEAGVPIISSMGAGNKMDPTAFEVNDIFSTSVCPLAKVMRRELRKEKIDRLKVVYSKEEPKKPSGESETGYGNQSICPPDEKRRSIPGSNAFVPPVAGFIIAGEVIKDLIGGIR